VEVVEAYAWVVVVEVVEFDISLIYQLHQVAQWQ
jgi:hypothetical protein